MKELFSKKTHRVLTLAKELVVEQKELDMQDIMSLNKCSLKTAYDDVNYCLEEYGHIFTDFSNGIIKSETTSVADLMLLKRDMFHLEPRMLILMNIAMNPDYKTIDHAVTLNYSESYIRKNIRLINDVIKRFNVYIIYCDRSHTYQLVGNHEISVILFLTQLIRVSKSENLLEDMGAEHLDIYKSSIKKLNINLTSFNKYEIKLLGQIVSMRHMQGFIHTYDDLTSAVYRFHKENYKTIEETITEIVKRNSFNLTADEYRDLLSSLMFIGIKIKFNASLIDNCFNRYHYFYDSYKLTNPDWCALHEKELLYLEHMTGINYSEYASEIFFNSFNLLINKAPVKKLNIGVFSDFGKYHESTIISVLNHNFQDQNLEHFICWKEYDLVISTTSRLRTNIEMILVSDIPSAKDVIKIYNRIYFDKKEDA